jgi:hypothetical protein
LQDVGSISTERTLTFSMCFVDRAQGVLLVIQQGSRGHGLLVAWPLQATWT